MGVQPRFFCQNLVDFTLPRVALLLACVETGSIQMWIEIAPLNGIDQSRTGLDN